MAWFGWVAAIALGAAVFTQAEAASPPDRSTDSLVRSDRGREGPLRTIRDWKTGIVTGGYDDGRMVYGTRCLVEADGLSFIFPDKGPRNVRVRAYQVNSSPSEESLSEVDVIGVTWNKVNHKASFSYDSPREGEVAIAGAQSLLIDVGGRWVRISEVFEDLIRSKVVVVIFRRNQIGRSPVRLAYNLSRAYDGFRRCGRFRERARL